MSQSQLEINLRASLRNLTKIRMENVKRGLAASAARLAKEDAIKAAKKAKK